MPFYDYIPERVRDRPITALAYLLFVLVVFSFFVLALVYGVVRILGVELVENVIKTGLGLTTSEGK